jgi:hypothetical protein
MSEKSKDRKEDSPEEKGTSSNANAVELDSDSEAEGAWAMWDPDSDDDSDNDSIDAVPNIASTKASDDTDWFSEAAEGDCEVNDVDWFTENSDDSEEAFVAAREAKPSLGVRFELLDSGCTQHIFPNRDEFENFQDISPKTFRAANEQSSVLLGKVNLSLTYQIAQMSPTFV